MAEAKKTVTKKPTVKKTVAKKVTPVAKTAKVSKAVKPTKAELVVDTTPVVEEAPVNKTVAKAGKRSVKGKEEATAKVEKIEKQVHKSEVAEDGAVAPKAVKIIRTKLERAGKKIREVAKLIDKEKDYTLVEALDLIGKTSTTKFDSTVELHVNLSVDPKHADQNIRDNLVLPNGTGRVVRVAVFADADLHAVAKKAGADVVGADDFLAQLDKEVIDFDILISTPGNMGKLGKYARLLGPKGLMPNPKSGTVTIDIEKAVAQAKAGRVEYRVDTSGIVHLGVGKVSFGAEKLRENVSAVFASIKAAKPASVKSSYVKAIHLTTTMGPSIRVAINEL